MVAGNLQSGVFGTPRQCLSADADSDIGMSIKRPRHISMNTILFEVGLDGRITRLFKRVSVKRALILSSSGRMIH